MRNWTRVLALILAAGAVAYSLQRAPQTSSAELPALGAKIGETSVSGISSGAYMAGQFQMAHAKIVKGAAIIAGGPYGCSESVFADAMPGPGTAFLNLSKAMNGCMLNLLGVWGTADPVDLAAKAKRRADRGEIDPIADVANDKVYLFSGHSDLTVVPAIVAAAAKFYAVLGVPASNIKHVTNLPSGHAFVTEDEGGACEYTGAPYVVDCDYDQAGELLKHIYGPLNPRSAVPVGDFEVFDQRPFTAGFMPNGMADHGVIYIPKACRSQAGCRIHIAYHGCAQSRAQVGDVFIKETGFARWADTNNLIVLFPQTAIAAFNPQGCWDWWGYTTRDYLARNAPQIVAVHRMLERLAARSGGV